SFIVPSGFGFATDDIICSFLLNPGFSIDHAGTFLPGLSKESFIKSLGLTDEAKAICFPSGLHRGAEAPYLNFVNCIGSPPANDKIKICGRPSTALTKASCFPSGLHAGCEAPSLLNVS